VFSRVVVGRIVVGVSILNAAGTGRELMPMIVPFKESVGMLLSPAHEWQQVCKAFRYFYNFFSWKNTITMSCGF
jgi:hypothetical protein